MLNEELTNRILYVEDQERKHHIEERKKWEILYKILEQIVTTSGIYCAVLIEDLKKLEKEIIK